MLKRQAGREPTLRSAAFLAFVYVPIFLMPKASLVIDAISSVIDVSSYMYRLVEEQQQGRHALAKRSAHIEH
jgi:hypothetical protein